MMSTDFASQEYIEELCILSGIAVLLQAKESFCPLGQHLQLEYQPPAHLDYLFKESKKGG